MARIQTPGGYEYEEADLEGKGDIAIKLPYAEAYNIILDALRMEASIEPLTEKTFQGNAEAILGLLIDVAQDETDEANFDDEYRGN